ncbi:MAG: hypothetical protein ACK48Z_09150 [Burkholderiales bacterium]|jgi:hypothetical protein
MPLVSLIVCFFGVLVCIFADVWTGLCAIGLAVLSIAFSVHTAVDLHRKAEEKEAERQRLMRVAKEAQEQKDKQKREWLERNKKSSPQTT